MTEIRRCVTCLFRNDKGEILVLEHKKCKSKLQLPAGTMEPNEISMGIERGSVITAVREMKEELGIDIKPNDLELISRGYAYYDRIDGHKIYRETRFSVKHYDNEIKNLEPEKHPELKWVHEDYIFEHPELFTYSTWLTVAEVREREAVRRAFW